MVSIFQNYFENWIGNIFEWRMVMGPVSKNFKIFYNFLKRKSSAILQFCYLQKLFHHFQLTRLALFKLSCPKEKVSLFSKKICYHWHLFHLNCYNNFSLSFLNKINTAIASLNPNDLITIILYGDKSFSKETNSKILTATIKFIKDTQCFEKFFF